MTSSPNEIVVEDIKPLLQLKRPLLSIDRYATREGISRMVVEEYGRLGIVQLRKYKGETYVVDVPLSPYHPVAEELEILQESPPAQSVQRAGHTTKSQTAEGHSQPVNKTSRVGKIAELAKNATNDTRKIADGAKRPNTSAIGGLKTKPKPAFAETLRAGRSGLGNGLISKASQIASKLARKNGASHAAHSDEFNPYESVSTSTPASVPQADRRQSDTDAEQMAQAMLRTDPQQNRQIAAVFLIVCFFGAFIACLWLYMNQKVHHGRIDQAYASIQNVYDDFVQSSQQLSTLQSKLVESTAEIEWIKNEVNISKQQEASVRKELGQLRTSIGTIQQNNTAALEQLKEQFQQLTAQLGKFIKNRQTFSDLSVPDK